MDDQQYTVESKYKPQIQVVLPVSRSIWLSKWMMKTQGNYWKNTFLRCTNYIIWTTCMTEMVHNFLMSWYTLFF